MIKLNPYAKVARRRTILDARVRAKKMAESAENKKKGIKPKQTRKVGLSKKHRIFKKRLAKERSKFYKTLLSN